MYHDENGWDAMAWAIWIGCGVMLIGWAFGPPAVVVTVTWLAIAFGLHPGAWWIAFGVSGLWLMYAARRVWREF